MAISNSCNSEAAAESLSTKYLGLFPNFMPELEKLVKASSERLLIASGSQASESIHLTLNTGDTRAPSTARWAS